MDGVVDNNNIPVAIAGIKDALDDGMEKVFKDTMDTAMSNWDSGADALGNPWEPLAPETIASKAGSDVLIESGDLKSNVKSTSRFDKASQTAIFSSSLDYAAVHEFGLPEKGIPRRPILGPMAGYAARNLDILEAEIDDALDNARVM